MIEALHPVLEQAVLQDVSLAREVAAELVPSLALPGCGRVHDPLRCRGAYPRSRAGGGAGCGHRGRLRARELRRRRDGGRRDAPPRVTDARRLSVRWAPGRGGASADARMPIVDGCPGRRAVAGVVRRSAAALGIAPRGSARRGRDRSRAPTVGAAGVAAYGPLARRLPRPVCASIDRPGPRADSPGGRYRAGAGRSEPTGPDAPCHAAVAATPPSATHARDLEGSRPTRRRAPTAVRLRGAALVGLARAGYRRARPRADAARPRPSAIAHVAPRGRERRLPRRGDPGLSVPRRARHHEPGHWRGRSLLPGVERRRVPLSGRAGGRGHA